MNNFDIYHYANTFEQDIQICIALDIVLNYSCIKYMLSYLSMLNIVEDMKYINLLLKIGVLLMFCNMILGISLRIGHSSLLCCSRMLSQLNMLCSLCDSGITRKGLSIVNIDGLGFQQNNMKDKKNSKYY